jgi:hypothetical protein
LRRLPRLLGIIAVACSGRAIVQDFDRVSYCTSNAFPGLRRSRNTRILSNSEDPVSAKGLAFFSPHHHLPLIPRHLINHQLLIIFLPVLRRPKTRRIHIRPTADKNKQQHTLTVAYQLCYEAQTTNVGITASLFGMGRPFALRVLVFFPLFLVRYFSNFRTEQE